MRWIRTNKRAAIEERRMNDLSTIVEILLRKKL